MTELPAEAVVLTSASIEELPWERLHGLEHVQYKLLWRASRSTAGVMRVDAGASLDAHVHQTAHHHVWVLDGRFTIVGRSVAAGSYVHVPAGVEHGITEVSAEGCMFLYLYLREAGG
jgi:quercetin dioxygenase-like cupin family protein